MITRLLIGFVIYGIFVELFRLLTRGVSGFWPDTMMSFMPIAFLGYCCYELLRLRSYLKKVDKRIDDEQLALVMSWGDVSDVSEAIVWRDRLNKALRTRKA